nr:hypothetical protein [Rhodococcus sp. USK13]
MILAGNSEVLVQFVRAPVVEQGQELGFGFGACEVVELEAETVDVHVAGYAQHRRDADAGGD